MSWSPTTQAAVDPILSTVSSATSLTERPGIAQSSPANSSESSQTLNSQTERDASITSSQNSKDRDRVTVPSACVQCRSKHLKCDGASPCTRCSANNFECIYVRSRRGFKGPRKNGIQSKAIPVPGNAVDKSCPMIHPNGNPRGASNVPSGLVTPPDHRLMTLPRPAELPLFDINSELVSFDPKPLPVGIDIRERCIEAYYFHFWPAHPFVLPRQNHFALRKEKRLGPLEAAMRYVGSMYVPQAPTVALALEAERIIYQADCCEDGFKVQAMLLLSLGLDGYTHQEKALEILNDAEALALKIGMNKREFAMLHANGSEVLEESWRRTWWEMYIVDGMIAGVHQKSFFPMKDIVADVLLPCEERDYLSGYIPPAHSLEDFDDESFDGRDLDYSSFTYRIAAMRNMGRVMTSRMTTVQDDPTIERVDAHLVTWRLHLPDAKKDFINSDGVLDEMIFQAHMITAATTIFLHREKSELDSSIARDITSCAPHQSVPIGQSYNIHAAKTIRAAQDISSLIQLPIPLLKHTHFFTCVVTLASIVHLSCWSVMMPLMHDDDLKQQLRLATGALKTLWQVWPSAGRAFGQVKGVAQDIWRRKRESAESGFWGALSEEEVMRSMIEDQTIMEEMQCSIE